MNTDSLESSLNDLLAQNHPGLMVERSKGGAIFITGLTKIEQAFYRIKLYMPHYPQVQDFQLYVQHHLEYKKFNSDNFENRAKELEDILCYLPKLLPAPEHTPLVQNNICADIVSLYKPIAYSMHTNGLLTRIKFNQFAGHEQHYLDFELPTLRLVEHSLPNCDVSWSELFTKNARSLSDMVHLFMKLLDNLQPFYNSFLNIDELCYVLQPFPVTTKHNTRVLMLRDRCYLKISITNPFACFSSMSVEVIGPTDDVPELRHVLNDGLMQWDPEVDIHQNLLRIFNLCYFPMRAENELRASQEQHCNICYVYRLENGEVPIVSCDNIQCVLKCHAACLSKWFKSLSDGKTFLEVSFGLCPYCKSKLSTSFATLLED